MPTNNHALNVPPKGAGDWGAQINQNFEAIEQRLVVADAENTIGDTGSQYHPHENAVFIATDTGAIYIGVGAGCNQLGRIPDIGGQRTTIDATQSGDGTTTDFIITHNTGEVPDTVTVTPKTPAASEQWWLSAKDADGVTISYATPPPSGTDNLAWTVVIER